MTPQEALSLFDYDWWATSLQFEAIAKLDEELYVKDLGSSHGGLRGTLVHIYAAQLIWYTRWKGDSPSTFATAAEISSLDMLRRRWETLRSEIHEFTIALTDEKLGKRVEYRDTRGNSHSELLSHQMRHLINHSTYHRGQITTMLRQLGAPPPVSVDLINYYRKLDEAEVKP